MHTAPARLRERIRHLVVAEAGAYQGGDVGDEGTRTKELLLQQSLYSEQRPHAVDLVARKHRLLRHVLKRTPLQHACVVDQHL